MEKIFNTIKKGVIENKRYTLNPIDSPIKLNQNESPYDLPLYLKEKIANRLLESNWNIYPEFVPEWLYEKVASHYSLKKENILVGNGSNEMINTVLTSILEDGKTLIVPVPTFTVYSLISSNLNANIIKVPLKDDLSFDVDSILSAVSNNKNSVTVICSPNNPTGTVIKKEDIEKIVKTSSGIVVIDEAYGEFGGESVIDLIGKYNNLVVLKTLSKAFGLASLRMGFMLGNEQLIAEFAKVKLPYNVNIFSLITLDEIFSDLSFLSKNIERIKNEREFLREGLQKFSKIKLYDTAANFFLIKVDDSYALFSYLIFSGILVRDISSYPMLKNHLRITVGNRYENETLLKALDKFYN